MKIISANMGPKNSFRAFSELVGRWLVGYDMPMLIGVVFVLALSLCNLYGIGGAEDSFFRRQIMLALGAFGVVLIIAQFNYRSLKNWSVPVLLFYGGAVFLLVLTFFFGEIRNIRAWIQLGGLRFEPSELAKYAVVILLAKYFSQRHVLIRQFRHVLITAFYAGVPAVLVLAQPDLGSATIIGVVWLAMLMASGVNWRHFFLICIVGVVGAYMAWIWALAPYQKDRILAFVDPYQDPTGYGYHIIQSKIAIGSGGLWGRGLGQGSQATLGFLPEPQNDFAFAAFVEQFGVVGAVGILGGLSFVLWRVLVIGRQAGNNFARLYCVGVATVIGAHVAISAGVNIGLLPITGIPMSFLSYGGSHLISTAVALGFVQSIRIHG